MHFPSWGSLKNSHRSRDAARLTRLALAAEDIAFALDISVDTLTRAIQRRDGTTFAQYQAKLRATFCMSIRSLQLRSAQRGDIQMLIWLGKQYLGQTKNGPANPDEWA